MPVVTLLLIGLIASSLLRSLESSFCASRNATSSGGQSIFNVSVDCCNASYVKVEWKADRINKLHLEYHCNTSPTFVFLNSSNRFHGSQTLLGNWTADEECSVIGCYENNAKDYPWINIINVTCISSSCHKISLLGETMFSILVSGNSSQILASPPPVHSTLSVTLTATGPVVVILVTIAAAGAVTGAFVRRKKKLDNLRAILNTRDADTEIVINISNPTLTGSANFDDISLFDFIIHSSDEIAAPEESGSNNSDLEDPCVQREQAAGSVTPNDTSNFSDYVGLDSSSSSI